MKARRMWLGHAIRRSTSYIFRRRVKSGATVQAMVGMRFWEKNALPENRVGDGARRGLAS